MHCKSLSSQVLLKRSKNVQITNRDLGTVEMVVHNLLYPLNWKLIWHQSQSWRFGEENSLCVYVHVVSECSNLCSLNFFVNFSSSKMPIDYKENIHTEIQARWNFRDLLL
jgi:hypothetical protein